MIINSRRGRSNFFPRAVVSRAVCASVLVAFAFALCSGWNLVTSVHAASGNSKPAKPAKPAKPYALLVGTVWTPDGFALPGVLVKIRRADQKKPQWEVYSNDRGEFMLRLPAGKADYIVWADMKGRKFAKGKELHAGPEVTVHIDNDERADVGLHLQ